ncbi:hypothetical protein F4678DRAFT_449212 [Xylaria arbuscula]|nr:hypothetical protein F4678DRAFT_449212 [Xylaria arbuscula]
MVKGVNRPEYMPREAHDGSQIAGSTEFPSAVNHEHELRPKYESSIRPSTSILNENRTTSHRRPKSSVHDPDLQDVQVPRAHKSDRRGRRGVRKMNIPTFTKLEDMWRFIEDKCTALEEQTHALVQSKSFTTFESQRRRCEVLMKKRNRVKPLITQYALIGDVDQSEFWNVRMAHTDGWLTLCQESCQGHSSKPKSTDEA